MIGNALSLAIVSVIGGVFIFNKLPSKIKKLLIKYGLFTDLACAIGIYILFQGTVTALFAAGFVGIIISAILHIANNKDDFLYIYDLKNFIVEQAKKAQAALTQYGRQYRS